MDIKRVIPVRPSNDKDFNIGKREKDCLTYVALMRVRNATAFAVFFPEYCEIDTDKFFVLRERGQRYCAQFFANAEHKRYLSCYKSTLEAFLGGTIKSGDDSNEVTEDRRENALRMLLDKALRLVEGGADLDPDTLKTITDLFKRLGVLKEDVEQEDAPRRYLPELCSRCRYKQFIDEQVALGNIEETNENYNN